jgi:NADH-quinone oxidoreductase subunit M
VTGALNGIAVLRAWFLLFTGSESAGTVPVGVTGRERFAVLVLATAVVGGGLVPQPWVHSRHEAAKDVLARREARLAPGLQGPVPPGSPRVNAEHGVP